MKKIIFSDLDGTLLDHENYSYKQAENALELLKEKETPLIFCTSKTRKEIEFWREKLDNKHPFISENGGGIFIPRNYFNFNLAYDSKNRQYFIITLGTPYKKLTKALKKLKKKFDIIGFNEMSVNDIAKDADLTDQQAEWTKQRDFDEPFKILDITQKEDIIKEITKLNLRYMEGGRYSHLTGLSDKGRAVMHLTDLLRRKYNHIQTIGIGDSENDFPMLDHVEHSYLVKQKNGKYASSRYKFADGIGPIGWQKAVKIELND
jgi:mannosyl-3-phosphoglycerate phosphatase